MAAPYLDLVAPAVAAVRAVLRDLDGDQIPADLRKIAAYAGGSLPPPLARSALKGLDRYDWLREKADALLADIDPGAEGPQGASKLLIARPDGWSAKFAVRVAEATDRAAQGSLATDRKRIEELQRKVETGRTAGRERIADLEAEVRRYREALDDERSQRRAMAADDARTEADVEAIIQRLRDDLAGQDVEIKSLQRDVARLSDIERTLRRERNSLEAALVEATTGPGWLGSNPVAVAAHLDQLAALARVPKPGSGGGDAPADRPLRLPSGVRPDRRDAIDWLLGLTQPVTLIVDGYNVGFHLTGAKEPAPARRRLGIELERLDRLAGGPLRIVVIYDTKIESAPPPPGRSGPEIRFTEPGMPADEEIAGMAASVTGSIVVISSDRWVRDVAEAAGAVGLWSESLVAWAGAR